MPNYRDGNLHGGSQSEYLAQYFLSEFGAAVFVPRQEDIGTDFHCSLAIKSGRKHTFHLPFHIQIGSKDTKPFLYGDVAGKGNKRRIRDWEIDFLREQQLPFFVGTVEKGPDPRFRIYSASVMWFVLLLNKSVGRIELIPENADDPIRKSKTGAIRLKGKKYPTFRIGLGPAIVDVRISQVNQPIYADATRALAKAIQIEHENLRYIKMGVPYVRREINGTPNVEGKTYNFLYDDRWGGVKLVLDRLRPVIIHQALAFHRKRPKRSDCWARLRPILELLPLTKEDREILNKHAWPCRPQPPII